MSIPFPEPAPSQRIGSDWEPVDLDDNESEAPCLVCLEDDCRGGCIS